MQSYKAETVPEGYMMDARGALIPVEKVKEIDRLRDEIVRAIVEKAINASRSLAALKLQIANDVEAFVDISAERYGVKMGGKKGNVQLTTFDGQYRIERAISDNVAFDERLQVAKKLIDECIQRWSQGANVNIKALVNDAFYVDKKGKVNTQRILGLRRLNIEDHTWLLAMDAIAESITINSTSTYLRVYERGGDGSYNLINLDIARL